MKDRMETVAAAAMLLLLCCGGSLVLGAIKVAARYHPLPAAGIALTAFLVHRAMRWHRNRQMLDRLAAEGWEPAKADQSWPWIPLQERPGQTQAHRAWTRTVDGLPVTAGEITWESNALNGSVKGWSGRGVFVVVRLPVPTEPMAQRRNRTIGTSHRLDFPAVRAAFATGEIPPWTAQDDHLFTFEAIPGQLRAGEVERAVERTLLVVRLLDLGAD